MSQVTKILRTPLSILTLFIWLVGNATTVQAQDVDIGLFHYHKVPGVLVSVNSGAYELWGDNTLVTELSYDDVISLKLSNKSIQVHGLSINYGNYQKVYIKQVEPRGSLRVKALTQPSVTNVYDHELMVTINGEALRVVNRVDLNHYVAGVVEREIGPSANLEYYKIQAVMCRTYALGNLNRHNEDGYQLCDEVHCQAYSGKSTRNRKIIIATAATNDMVLVDQSNQLILAAYHSNCGGETMGAEKVWTTSKPYLQPVKDTFCINMNSATWEQVINRDEFEGYIIQFPDIDSLPAKVCFIQNGRQDAFVCNGTPIPIRRIRKDWHFKSSYFNIKEQEDGQILVSGRGYGHGVGLCQQGALRMTELGYKYRAVFDFYFHNVRITSYSSLERNAEAME